MAEKDKGDKRRDDVEQVVRRYFALLNELEPDVDALDAIVSKRLEQIEHPNAVSPKGLRRGKQQLLEDQQTQDVLAEQRFDIRDVVVAGSTAAVRGVWTGTLRDDGGTRLVAHVAAFVKVKDGQVVEHETYECYEKY